MSQIVYPTGIVPAGESGEAALFQRYLKIREPWLTHGLLTGLTAGAGTFTKTFYVSGYNTIRLEIVGTFTGLSLQPQALIDPSADDTGAFTNVGSALTAAGFVTLDNWYRLLRFNFTALTTGSAVVNLLVARS